MKNITEIARQFINGTYTKSDVTFLATSIKKEDGSQEMDKVMDAAWNECQDLDTSASLNEQYKYEAKQLLKKIEKKNKRTLHIPYFRYIAAIALMVLVSTGIYKLYRVH